MSACPRSFFASLMTAALLAAVEPKWKVAAQDLPVPQPSSRAVRLIDETLRSFTTESVPPVVEAPVLSLGTSDFTVGLELESLATETGDLLSLWNGQTRHGFTLTLRTNSGVTTSQPNWRQLQFGIDAGTEPTWRDEGRPGSAILGFSMAVHDGQLYVGTCEPEAGRPGRVYRYAGPDQWIPLGPLDGSNSVTALATYHGALYAATGKYRLGGSALTDSSNDTTGGRIYRLKNGHDWELVGDLSPTEAIAGLVTFEDRLYASSLYRPAGFFRYEGGTSWTSLPVPNGDRRVEALGVHAGRLYASSYDSGSVYLFDGTQWEDLGLVSPDDTQTYSFATFGDALHVSTWPTGRVMRLGSDRQWIDAGRLGTEQEVMGMLVHNGVFYAGTLPRAEVYRYEGDRRWSLLKQLDTTPDVKYRRVWTMATYQGRLFATTLPSGHVWSMSAGSLVTDDRELTAGWHQIVAERKQGELRLYVDGRFAARSPAISAALNTEGLHLQIGRGPSGAFTGRMKNVWIDVAP